VHDIKKELFNVDFVETEIQDELGSQIYQHLFEENTFHQSYLMYFGIAHLVGGSENGALEAVLQCIFETTRLVELISEADDTKPLL
jgi:hypothetical protein